MFLDDFFDVGESFEAFFEINMGCYILEYTTRYWLWFAVRLNHYLSRLWS